MQNASSKLSDSVESIREKKAAAQKLVRKKARIQIMIVITCAAGIMIGSRYSKMHHTAVNTELNPGSLQGKWELKSVNGDPVGPNVQSVVLDQQVNFQDGEVHGQTRLHADTPSGTTNMPLPDETATEVKTSADGKVVTIRWDGTYNIKSGNRLELHIGKATYNAIVSPNIKKHTLELDHDTILTFPGKALYSPVEKITALH